MLRCPPSVIAGVFGPGAGDFRTELQTALDQCVSSVPMKTTIYGEGLVMLGCRWIADQPEPCFKGNPVVIGSGELYNSKQLWVEPKERAGQTPSRSLQKLVARLYQTKGPGGFKQLDGRFALALWDGGTQTLLLTRDALAAKPLFLARHAQGWIFASDTRALRSLLKETRPSAESILQYLLFNYPLGSNTYYEGITSLDPGAVYRLQLHGRPEVVARSEPVAPPRTTEYLGLLDAVVQAGLVRFF